MFYSNIVDVLIANRILPILFALNNHMLTKSEAKDILDVNKYSMKSYLSYYDYDRYSFFIDYSKLLIDLRNDIPEHRFDYLYWFFLFNFTKNNKFNTFTMFFVDYFSHNFIIILN